MKNDLDLHPMMYKHLLQSMTSYAMLVMHNLAQEYCGGEIHTIVFPVVFEGCEYMTNTRELADKISSSSVAAIKTVLQDGGSVFDALDAAFAVIRSVQLAEGRSA